MSGELYGLSGPGQRVSSPPPQSTEAGESGLIDLGSMFSGGLIGALLGGGGSPLIPEGMNPIDFLASLMGLRWDQVDAIEDGQLGLVDRVDLLSALEDRGSAYASGQGELINTGRVPFNHPVGPMKGVRLENSGFTLLKRGAWDIEARLAFSYTLAPGGGAQSWEIRVYRPDGTLFSRQVDGSNEANANTRGMFSTVVVPDENYRVEVWITQLIAVRATIGGPENNRFTVKHISDSIENPI